MSDGMQLSEEYVIRALQNMVAEQSVRIAMLEAAVQQVSAAPEVDYDEPMLTD